MADFPVFSNFVFVKCCFYVLFIVNNVINFSRLIVFRYMFLSVITFFSWTIQLKPAKLVLSPSSAEWVSEAAVLCHRYVADRLTVNHLLSSTFSSHGYKRVICLRNVMDMRTRSCMNKHIKISLTVCLSLGEWFHSELGALLQHVIQLCKDLN